MVEEAVAQTPSQSRRARAKDELRQSILDAARAVALRDGWTNVTTRKVAGEIEYTHPTIYEHFATKDALLAELNRVGYNELLHALRDARTAHGEPVTALYALADAYCNFAWQKRELYEVMYGLSGVHIEESSYHDEAQAVISEARSALQLWARSEQVRLANLDDAVLQLWSMLHGIASLALSKLMIGGKKHALLLARNALGATLAGWKATYGGR